MTIYADSSFFVSHYLQDAHSAEAQRRMLSLPEVWFTPFQRVELIHAVFQHCFRNYIGADEARIVLADLDRDCKLGVWRLRDQPPGTFARCEQIARRRVATLGVRTLDTLHVAAALELGATHFWTFDQRQTRLAEAEGLLIG